MSHWIFMPFFIYLVAFLGNLEKFQEIDDVAAHESDGKLLQVHDFFE